jgi:hypothetical protein
MITGKDIEIFSTAATTTESPPFYVTPGWAMTFHAFGLDRAMVRIDPDHPDTEQKFCLNHMILKFRETETGPLPCGVIRSPEELGDLEIVAEEPFVYKGCEWYLSACNNFGILALPGYYRLVLNDPAALGTARAYATAYRIGGDSDLATFGVYL